MNLVAQILTYITETLGMLFLAAVVLRFFLQLARADFYNPFSQAIVKITNPFLIPLRRVIPGVMGIDLASVFLAIFFQFLLGAVNFFIVTQEIFNPLSTLIFGILGTLRVASYLIFGIGIIVVIASFVAPYSSHPIILLSRQIIDPLARPFQKLLPPMGGLDLSLLFVFMGNKIFAMILDAAATKLGLFYPPLNFLVIGY